MDATKYKYYRRFEDLEIGYNHVIVVVKCEPAKDNNFVLTANTFANFDLHRLAKNDTQYIVCLKNQTHYILMLILKKCQRFILAKVFITVYALLS